jgi:hypothetical protein
VSEVSEEEVPGRRDEMEGLVRMEGLVNGT